MVSMHINAGCDSPHLYCGDNTFAGVLEIEVEGGNNANSTTSLESIPATQDRQFRSEEFCSRSHGTAPVGRDVGRECWCSERAQQRIMPGREFNLYRQQW